jgi:hypothetical protein
MLALDLKKIRPFDVLLTAESDRISRLIRFAQSLDRRITADFSHAALFVAPTLIFESNTSGIGFVDLTKRTVFEVLAQVANSAAEEDAAVVQSTSIVMRDENGHLSIYGLLPDIEAAIVLRNRALEGKIPTSRYDIFNIKLREVLIRNLMRAYPTIGRLLHASQWLPATLAGLAEALWRKFKTIEMEGLFCSELVAEIFIDDLNVMKGNAFNFAPSDFANSVSFNRVSDAVIDIPEKMCVSHGLTVQRWIDLCLLITPLGRKYREPIVELFNPIGSMERDPEFIRKEIKRRTIPFSSYIPEHTDLDPARKKYVEDLIDRSVAWAYDSCFFWSWLLKSADCYVSCPNNKRQFMLRLGDFDWGLKLVKNPAQNERCRDIFACNGEGISPFADLRKSNYMKWWRDPFSTPGWAKKFVGDLIID